MTSPAIVNLLDWQKNWINDEARYKLVVASAQSGKSFGTTLEFTLDAVAGKTPLGIFLSASDRQSIELMEKVNLHTKALGAVCDNDSGFWEGTSIMQHTARFGNGARLIALPANPDTARGYSGNLFFDEFAMHRDSRAIWAAGMTRATRGYKVRVASTFKGLKNKFGELAKMLGLADGIAPVPNPVEREGWSGHWVDIFMAAAQGAPVNPQQIRQAIDDEEIFGQEYCNIPMEDASSFIPIEMVMACESGLATVDWDCEPGELYAGMDIGRKKDRSVIWIVRESEGRLITVGVMWMDRMPFAEQLSVARQVAKQCRRMSVDATGIGAMLAEQLRCEYPWVEEVTFTAPIKERMAVEGKKRLEEQTLLLPPDSRTIRNGFTKVKRMVGSTGVMRFDAERTDAGHADEFWAAMLAVSAAGGAAGYQSMADFGAIGGRTVLGNFMERRF